MSESDTVRIGKHEFKGIKSILLYKAFRVTENILKLPHSAESLLIYFIVRNFNKKINCRVTLMCRVSLIFRIQY